MNHDYQIRIFLEAMNQVYSEAELLGSVQIREQLEGFLKVPLPVIETLIEGALQIRALRAGRSLQGVFGEVVQ